MQIIIIVTINYKQVKNKPEFRSFIIIQTKRYFQLINNAKFIFSISIIQYFITANIIRLNIEHDNVMLILF